ncbi:hypothetical protein DPX16_12174 [Anabarilius grahami]|uniref:Uncharacterized protein n=1 Tax=Anabarilius grahami TaxID=495550 RepID=A0A3N0YS81_ANAGA|nr:hypothetical protein DPX16_12174 [Anabarilius grahami]
MLLGNVTVNGQPGHRLEDIGARKRGIIHLSIEKQPVSGDSNPRLGLSSKLNPPYNDTTLRENKRNRGGDGEEEGCWKNCRWDDAVTAAYIRS